MFPNFLHQKFLNKTSKEFEHELIETLIESSLLHTTASAHPLDVRFEIIRERNLLVRLSNRLKMEVNTLEIICVSIDIILLLCSAPAGI
jgi:hypothetical protein